MSGTQGGPKNAVHNESRARKEKYKELLDMGAAIDEGDSDSLVHTLQKVTTLMSRSNALSAEVHSRDRADNTSEVVLDAQVLKMSYELMGNALSKAADSEFNDDDFYNAIMHIIGKQHDWDKLSPYFLKGARIFNPTPSMMGTFKFDAPSVQSTQKERRQRARNELTQQVKPHTEKPKATEETKRAQFLNVIMKHLNKLLKDNDNEPIPYYKLICDPESFQYTIDNLFQLSFLFRDGFISLDYGDDELPMVTLVTDLQKKNKNSTGNHQFVSSMDPSLWQRMIARYNIKQPMLKINREEFFNLTQGKKT